MLMCGMISPGMLGSRSEYSSSQPCNHRHKQLSLYGSMCFQPILTHTHSVNYTRNPNWHKIIFVSILACFSVTGIKPSDQKQLGEKRVVHLADMLQFFIKRCHHRNSKQESGRGSWNRGHGRTLFTGFLSFFFFFFIKPRPTCWSATTYNVLSPPMPIINQTMPFIYIHRPIWWKQFLNWGVHFPGDSVCVKLTELTTLSDNSS